MRAFTKFSDAPIGDRSAIAKADFVVYLDETLFSEGWESELKPGGMVLVNSRCQFGDPRVLSLDANGISEAVLGRSIPNTVFLGAIAALCPQLSPEVAKEAVTQYMAPRLHEKNWAIIDEAVAMMKNGLGSESGSVDDDAPGNETHQEQAAEIESLPYESPSGIRCKLRDESAPEAPSLDPAVFAKNTCYPAGHLVTKNAGWRNVRPVLDAAKCTMCLQCYLYCPDGTIFKVRNDGNQVTGLAIDYDFCKGCGVCVRACRFNAIEMVDEAQALAAETALESAGE